MEKTDISKIVMAFVIVIIFSICIPVIYSLLINSLSNAFDSDYQACDGSIIAPSTICTDNGYCLNGSDVCFSDRFNETTCNGTIVTINDAECLADTEGSYCAEDDVCYHDIVSTQGLFSVGSALVVILVSAGLLGFLLFLIMNVWTGKLR